MRMLPAVCFGLLSTAFAVAVPAMGQDTDGAGDDGVTLDLDALDPPAAESENDGEERREPSDGPAPPSGAAKSEAPPPEKTVVAFDADAVELTEADRARLRTLAESLKKSKSRLTIVAYASVNDERSANAARRLALARAINLRHVLVAEGVDGTRINLKPEDSTAGETGPGNRAEIIIDGG